MPCHASSGVHECHFDPAGCAFDPGDAIVALLPERPVGGYLDGLHDGLTSVGVENPDINLYSMHIKLLRH